MDPLHIPVFTLEPELDVLWEELEKVVKGVLRSGVFIAGPNVSAFEHEVAAYLGVKHAVGLNSGTDALCVALRALEIGSGDEVITSPFTFFATAEAISQVGATPVFVDIEPSTFTLDPAKVEAAITCHTKAVIPVHLYGQTANMDPILEIAHRHNLKVVEDVAQAFGATYQGRRAGTLGDCAAFSFFPTKNLGGYGDGGLMVTDDDQLAETARMLRMHGSKKKYHNEMVGYNSRLDELQAAILRVKLKRVDEWNAGRRRVAATYNQLLGTALGVVVPLEAEHGAHVYHQYTVRVTGGRRDDVQSQLHDAGIGTMVYYPIPVHKLPVYKWLNSSAPKSEQAATEVLSLPIWPQMNQATQERVAEALLTALARAEVSS